MSLDQIHAIAMGLRPKDAQRQPWQALLSAQEVQPLKVSFLLDQALPSAQPELWPDLIVHLAALDSDRWELLIPGPSPPWIDNLRPWLSGALRIFPKLSAQALQEQARVLAGGEWLLPVTSQTHLHQALLDALDSSCCWNSPALLLGPDPVIALHRQALWDPPQYRASAGDSTALLLIGALITQPGRWLIPMAAIPAPSIQPLQILCTCGHQPRALLIEPHLLKRLGGRQHPASSLVQRAAAIGIPPLLALADQQKPGDERSMPVDPRDLWNDPSASIPLQERSQHGLLLTLDANQPLPIEAEAWALAGFRPIPMGTDDLNDAIALARSMGLRWLTWLSADSLISANALDRLRLPAQTPGILASLPRLLDRGSGAELSWPPTPSERTGLTLSLPDDLHPGMDLPAQESWQCVKDADLAINRRPEPESEPLRKIMRKLHQLRIH